LDRLGITYIHETFGKRNRIERVVQGDEGQGQEAPQQHKREDAEEPRRAGNYNCSNAQHHQTRMRRGNTNLTVPLEIVSK
jgi:hypothetical protein